MSPKGHFCTLSLLKRNKAASWDEPKKKKISPPLTDTHTRPHWHALCHLWCLYFGTEVKSKERFPGHLHLFLLLHVCLCDDSLCFFPCVCFGALVFGFVFLSATYQFPLCTPRSPYTGERTPSRKAAGVFPNVCRRLVAIREKQALVLRVLLLILQITPQPTSAKISSPLCCTKRGHLPSLRKDANIALFWNTASLIPCSGVCSSDGVLRRPICLADHCLFDVAANVTFLFQSKTQQGVPSVWHRPSLTSPMPFCADHFTWQFAKNLSFLGFAKYNSPKWAVFSECQQDSQMGAVFPEQPISDQMEHLSAFFFNEQIPHCHFIVYLKATCLLRVAKSHLLHWSSPQFLCLALTEVHHPPQGHPSF